MTSIYARQKNNLINRMIRTNHAGEYAAQRIYQGQLAVIHDNSRETIEEMLHSEEAHLAYFTQQIQDRKTRPSLLLPLVHRLAFSLGHGGAKISTASAMACTIAVEEVISRHYAEQLEQLPPEEAPLSSAIARYKAEEEEHQHIATQCDGKTARAYYMQTSLIKAACRFAIKLVGYL